MTNAGDPEILFANERFYAAFSQGDLPAMAALWSENGPICCLHPGWEPLNDRDRILASWEAIFQAPPPVRCVAPEILPLGRDGAAVVCWEEIDGDYLLATNLFRHEDGMWRMVHHQAGPTRGEPPVEGEGEAPHRLN